MSLLTRNRRPDVDWRAAATTEQLREYDAFGPWIDEVTSPELMPPRFRPFHDELGAAQLALKFPRPVERARVRPGQDLYAAVLAIQPDRLTLLQLPAAPGDAVIRRVVEIQDVVAVASLVNLLVGRWSLLLRDGSRLDLEHPTLSQYRVDAATDLVRGLCAPGATTSSVPPMPPVEVTEIALRNALTGLRPRCAEPPVPLHFEPRNVLRRDARGRFVLTSALVLADAGGELVVVHGGAPRRPWRGPGYAWTTVFVGYGNLTSYSVVEPTRPRQLHELVLTAGEQVIRVPCASRPDAVLDVLAARGVPAARPLDAMV
nr:hypothetical protein [Propionicimonas sp.]